ncbi:MAG TPA: AAA family ATPase, partial [Ferroplasma sp.]|nr:AAA family ATPase [Ferroplasma sp.]
MENSKSAFRNIISEWLLKDIPQAKKRDITIPLDSSKIITIAGPRRSGKTYLLFSTINNLLKNEPKNNILYINFEDERLLNVQIGDLENIIPIFYELANPDKEKNIYLFFDEIQNIEYWEKYIRRIYDSFQYKIYLSGSSSKLLGREISTSLRGRSIEYIITPLTFKEYMEFNGKEYSNLIGFADQRGYLLSELNNYFTYGGYPEVVLEKNNDMKLKILKSYYNTTFSMDMGEHFNISEIGVLDAFMKYLIS